MIRVSNLLSQLLGSNTGGLTLFALSAALAISRRRSRSGHVDGKHITKHWINKDGEHEFLKEVLGEKSLTWVKGMNEQGLRTLGNPENCSLYGQILSILDSSDKIPYLRKINGHFYNFWQDKTNPRGLWRRTTLESYLSKATVWETVIDFDELGRLEEESWVYKGHTIYEPDLIGGRREPVTRTIMQLSRGGADAVVLREFDLERKVFIPASEGGFVVPESKSRVAWKTKDILLIGTDLQDGQSMTNSGYPRVMREWQRGTPLTTAIPIVHAGEQTDVSVYMYVSKHRQHSYLLRGRAITFYTSKNEIFLPDTTDNATSTSTAAGGKWHELPLPLDAELSIFVDQLLVQLRSEWTVGSGSQTRTVAQGSLIAASVTDFVAKGAAADFVVLFEPTSTVSLDSFASTRDYLILETLDTVKSRYVFWRYEDKGGAGGGSPQQQQLRGEQGKHGWVYCGAEEVACVRGSSLVAVDAQESNEYWLTSSSFLQPTTLSLGDASAGPAGVAQARPLKALPAQFNAQGLVEQQFLATSADGTKVPYFIVSHKDMPLDGSTPTLLYGYGGFEISLPPSYNGVVGAGWLDTSNSAGTTGGCKYRCYVQANIRGGGEFGPSWHQAALRENRYRAYDDFIAVAEDLIARGVTSPAKLGIRGGSNGGLLMGNMMVRRPDLFAAVCCAVPLLDMRCYHTLLAGASWMAEYGNPDVPEDWAFLQRYSAYHNIDPVKVAAGQYPALLMTTSTRDDRVHPYHARCFVRRLLDCAEQGGDGVDGAGSGGDGNAAADKVLYYENIEGGHGGAADNKQQAFMSTLYLNFLRRVLKAE